jgi:hypothetical protein
MDGLVNALASRPTIPLLKVSAAAKSSGSIHSLWKVGGNPTAGANPLSGNGEIPTSSTVGSLKFANAGGGNSLYIGKLGIQCSTAGTILVYDRLWSNSGLNGTLTTAQTFTMPSLTRNVDGIGVEAYLEIYTATGSTAVTATILYTNTDNVSGRSGTTSIIASPAVGQMFIFTLQAGDSGIKSIQQVTLSATTGTAGNFGLTLLKRKSEVPITLANTGAVLDSIALGLPPIENNACIAFMVQTTTTNTGVMMGTIVVIEG